jgi:phage terminase small subunit
MTQPKTPKAQRSAKLQVVAGTDVGADKKKRPPPKGRSPLQPNGLTAKQEAFALAIFNGSNFSDAYREAYDAENMQPVTIHRQAYELAINSKVAARLDELHREREQQRRMQSLSRSDLVLKQLTDLALSSAVQDGARVRALELLGKSVALFTDRVETEDKTDSTADEIERDLADKLRRLGLA